MARENPKIEIMDALIRSEKRNINITAELFATRALVISIIRKIQTNAYTVLIWKTLFAGTTAEGIQTIMMGDYLTKGGESAEKETADEQNSLEELSVQLRRKGKENDNKSMWTSETHADSE